jgi:predicted DNA-binding transcriptional regulator AlpA
MTATETAASEQPRHLERLLKIRDLYDMGVASTYRMLRQKIEHEGFPPPRYIGPRSPVWTLSEVMAWVNSRSRTPADTPQIRGARRHQRKLRRQRRAQAAE